MSVQQFQSNDLVRRVGGSDVFTVKNWYEAVNKYSVWKRRRCRNANDFGRGRP